MKAAIEAIEVRKTENDVAAESYRAMTETGGEFFCNSPIVTAGPKSGIAHTTYHRRTLERGDPVAIEIGATFNRYTSPLFRTAAVGEATPELQRMHDACKEAMEVAIEGDKAGRAVSGCPGGLPEGDRRSGFRATFQEAGGVRAGGRVSTDVGRGTHHRLEAPRRAGASTQHGIPCGSGAKRARGVRCRDQRNRCGHGVGA